MKEVKTHCKYGHLFSEENTYTYIRKNRNGLVVRNCKECRNKRSAKWMFLHRYIRGSMSYEEHCEAVRAYRQTEKGKDTAKRGWEKSKIKFPEKIKARNLLRSAVRYGRVQKLPCQICSSEKSQGHHEDYTKPLEAIWLCPKHHKKLHLGRLSEEELGMCKHIS